MENLNKQISKCTSDLERWKILIDNPSIVTMWLDNDQTAFSIDDGDTWHYFNGYIGWNDCAVALGEALGFRSCEPV